jgi:hypothetical protein
VRGDLKGCRRFKRSDVASAIRRGHSFDKATIKLLLF